MSLGWGLRGSIGGGSLGAMIPGAMPSGLNAGPAISVSPALREMSELRSSK